MQIKKQTLILNDLIYKPQSYSYNTISNMKSIIKNKSNLQFLNKPLETLERSNNLKMPNKEIVKLYRDVLKMTQRFTWNNEDG